MAIYPNSNLPTASQPWGRAMQAKVETLDSQFLTERTNNTARDAQLQASYNRLDKTINQVSAVANQAQQAADDAADAAATANSAATTANNAIAAITSLGTPGSSTIVNASNIVGGTITGITVQTASSGQRVVMGGTQLNFYDGSGALGATMSASSSALSISNGGNTVNVNTTGSHMTGGSTGVYCGDYGSGTSVLKLVGASTEATGTLYSSGVLSTGGYFSCPDTRTRSTTGGLAVFVASNGTYHVGSSSRRFKQDILDYAVDYDAFLKMNPVTFRYKSEVEEVGDSAGTTVGFIAEDLQELGLDEYVVLDDSGDAFGINYSNMVVGLTAIVAKQDEMIKSLTARIEALESKV